MLKLNKQLAGFLIAIFALVSLGVTTVQANSMEAMMTSMTSGMDQSMSGKCKDCGSPDGSKDMIGCSVGGCVAPLLGFSPLVNTPVSLSAAAFEIGPILALNDNQIGPEPYPPRTIHMG